VGELKYVGVLKIYKILFMYIYCEFVGLDNNLYKMHGTHIKILVIVLLLHPILFHINLVYIS